MGDKVNRNGSQGSSNRRLLHWTIAESHVELLRFILDCLDCKPKKKIEILTNKFNNDRTVHLSIKESGTDEFDSLFTWLGSRLANKDLKNILTCKGQYNDTIRQRAVQKNNTEIVRKIDEKHRHLI